jgi:hypothetical protein
MNLKTHAAQAKHEIPNADPGLQPFKVNPAFARAALRKKPLASLTIPGAPKKTGRPKPPTFYGPENKTKLPDPAALARVSTESLKNISAASALRGARYPK